MKKLIQFKELKENSSIVPKKRCIFSKFKLIKFFIYLNSFKIRFRASPIVSGYGLVKGNSSFFSKYLHEMSYPGKS